MFYARWPADYFGSRCEPHTRRAPSLASSWCDARGSYRASFARANIIDRRESAARARTVTERLTGQYQLHVTPLED